VWVPVLARALTVNFRVDFPEPGAAMELGENDAVTPDGRPDADKAIAELKPVCADVVIVTLPKLPSSKVSVTGDTVMVKLGGAVAVTVRVTVAVCVRPPPTPVIVIGYVPVAVVEPTVKVKLEEPAPVMELGLKPAATPAGAPEAVKAIVALKPPVTVAVMVEFPLLPCTTETELGEAEMAKFGLELVPASALIRAAPFGLPQPVTKSYPATAGYPLVPLVMSWK